MLLFGKDFDRLEEHFGFVRDKPSIASHIQSILRWHKADQPRAAKFQHIIPELQKNINFGRPWHKYKSRL